MKNKRKVSIINLFFSILLIILIYLLIHYFGYINEKKKTLPTGNIDIIDIDDNITNNTNNTNNTNDTNDTNKNPNNVDNQNNIDKNKLDNKSNLRESNFIVEDNYSIWNSKRLRIFTNQAYQYTSKIAPNLSNSYDFIIKNNSKYDLYVDIYMEEENPFNINMKYKLRSNNNYLVGSKNKYADVSKLSQRNILIKANSSKEYSLDWKWIDSDNDTEIGENINSNYKLSINIGANQK